MIAWLSEEDVLTVHEKVIARYGGSGGVRDYGLLQSALAKPKNLYYYNDAPTLAALAASYVYGLVKNHPFVDGNKRVGFGAGELSLRTNGFGLKRDEEAATGIILSLAAGETSEAGLVEFFEANTVPLGVPDAP